MGRAAFKKVGEESAQTCWHCRSRSKRDRPTVVLWEGGGGECCRILEQVWILHRAVPLPGLVAAIAAAATVAPELEVRVERAGARRPSPVHCRVLAPPVYVIEVLYVRANIYR